VHITQGFKKSRNNAIEGTRLHPRSVAASWWASLSICCMSNLCYPLLHHFEYARLLRRLFLTIMFKQDIIHKSGSTQHITMPSQEDQLRKNVCNNSKNVKKVLFWIWKKTFNNVHSFRGHLITLIFNTQLPKVSTGKSPTSNILLCNDVSIITQPKFYFQKPDVWKY